MSLPRYEDLGERVYCIDTDQLRPRMAACYLLVDDGEAALVDTGTNPGAESVLALIAHLGLAPEQVRYVLPTHVHLDHAGAAGRLMQALPEATLVAHPRAARHLIDPSKLEAGARAVYGETFDVQFGALVPVAAERVVEIADEDGVMLGTRRLRFLHTEGHARHHYCVFDEADRTLYSGDTFGVCYPDLSGPGGALMFPPTTPVQFDPEAWVASVERLLALEPRRVCLTHYGAVTDIDRLGAQLVAGITEFAALAQECAGIADPAARERAIRMRVDRELRGLAETFGLAIDDRRWAELMDLDLGLNAQGLNVWLSASGAVA